jgi:DNA-binding MarR family transcriptional regulator
VTLNISATHRSGATAKGRSTATAEGKRSPRRQRLYDEMVAEMTAWNPRERMGIFRKWLAGSLSLIHLHVLSILEADGPMSMSALADALDVSVASATGIVSRMEQRGLVERRHGDRDRRIVLVDRAEAGKRITQEITEIRRIGLIKLLDRLTEAEMRSFIVGVRAVKNARAALAAEAETLAADSPTSHEGRR